MVDQTLVKTIIVLHESKQTLTPKVCLDINVKQLGVFSSSVYSRLSSGYNPVKGRKAKIKAVYATKNLIGKNF